MEISLASLPSIIIILNPKVIRAQFFPFYSSFPMFQDPMDKTHFTSKFVHEISTTKI